MRFQEDRTLLFLDLADDVDDRAVPVFHDGHHTVGGFDGLGNAGEGFGQLLGSADISITRLLL